MHIFKFKKHDRWNFLFKWVEVYPSKVLRILRIHSNIEDYYIQSKTTHKHDFHRIGKK